MPRSETADARAADHAHGARTGRRWRTVAEEVRQQVDDIGHVHAVIAVGIEELPVAALVRRSALTGKRQGAPAEKEAPQPSQATTPVLREPGTGVFSLYGSGLPAKTLPVSAVSPLDSSKTRPGPRSGLQRLPGNGSGGRRFFGLRLTRQSGGCLIHGTNEDLTAGSEPVATGSGRGSPESRCPRGTYPCGLYVYAIDHEEWRT